MGLGATEIILIVAVVVVFFFGAKKIPELARGIGQGINEFKKVSDEAESDESQQETSNHGK